MGERGPAPTPTALKVLHGETRPSRLNALEPRPREGLPRPPRKLSKEERRHWNRFVRELGPMGLLTPVDADMLLALVTARIRADQASADIAERGHNVPGANGAIVRNPSCIVEATSLAHFERLSRRFGLDPSSRASLRVKPPPPDSPLGGLLS